MKLSSKEEQRGEGGFTLVEIMIVVAIIGLLSSIAIPNFVRARTTSQVNACINNLRQIDSAKQLWALENKQGGAVTPSSSAIAPYLGRPIIGMEVNTTGGQIDGQVNCPSGGAYTINDLETPPECDVTDHELP